MQQTMQVSQAVAVPACYREFVDHMINVDMTLTSVKLGTEEEVTRAILTAATDDWEKFRYLVGADTEQSAHMRRKIYEDEYIAWTCSRFE